MIGFCSGTHISSQGVSVSFSATARQQRRSAPHKRRASKRDTPLPFSTSSTGASKSALRFGGRVCFAYIHKMRNLRRFGLSCPPCTS